MIKGVAVVGVQIAFYHLRVGMDMKTRNLVLD